MVSGLNSAGLASGVTGVGRGAHCELGSELGVDLRLCEGGDGHHSVVHWPSPPPPIANAITRVALVPRALRAQVVFA